MSKERIFSDSEVLLSTTDLDSYIKYANDSFCAVAEYTLDELKGAPHNKVRHPDMPKAAFKDLWATIKSGKSWMGPVKNRCKGGDYYWVNAFVTPIRNEQGKIVEYQSVRTVLDSEVKQRAEQVYPKLDSEPYAKSITSKLDKTLWVQLLLLLASVLCLFSTFHQGYSIVNSVLFVKLLLVNAVFYIWRNQYKELVAEAADIFDNPLMSYLYSGTRDKMGAIALALKMRKAEMRAVVGRVNDDSINITATATSSSKLGSDVASILASQKVETEQVASAIHEMSATVNDIAKIVAEAANASQNGQHVSSHGQQTVSKSSKSIQELSQQLSEVDTAISRLIDGTRSIEVVLTEISSIADQTNLLALNAAIEAARAGEQGRGFAVVAEEVRALAMRTQQSTVQVGKLTSKLRDESDFVIHSMNKGRSLSSDCVAFAESTSSALAKLDNEMRALAELNTQVAAAVEEQSVVTEQINRSITEISDMSKQSEQNGSQAANLGANVVSRLVEQQRLISQFNR